MSRRASDVTYTVNGYFQTLSKQENQNAPTYWERIAPTLVTAEEYFETVRSKSEWVKERYENIARNIYGVEVTVTVSPKAE